MKKTEQQKKLEGTARKDRQAGKSTVDILEKLPLVKADYNLDKNGKRWYKLLGNLLIDTNRLTAIDLPNLVMMARNWAQWSWANEAMNQKNGLEMGTGYMQVFESGATNITTEYKIMTDAEDAIVKISKLFGMSFKDRHSIASFFEDASGQLSLFDEINEAHPDNGGYELKVVGE